MPRQILSVDRSVRDWEIPLASATHNVPASADFSATRIVGGDWLPEATTERVEAVTVASELFEIYSSNLVGTGFGDAPTKAPPIPGCGQRPR